MKKKKNQKVSIKKILKLIIPIILLIIIIGNYNNIYVYYLSKKTGYQKEAIKAFLKDDIYKDIKHNNYSKTLDTIINSKYFDKKYLNEYQDILYLERNNYIENINALLNNGYNSKEINKIYNKLNDENINIIIEGKYIAELFGILNLDYFHEYNLEAYLGYISSNKDSLTEEEIVTNVNIGLNNKYYTNVNKIENPDEYLVIVNKYNYLNKDYEPKDLEILDKQYRPSWKEVYLRKDAKIAFQEMCSDANKDNIKIYGGSGYRSYNYQLNLYNNYVKKDGINKADTYSARAGYSEHQTGLAMDILNSKWDYISKNDKEYTWLINNSYKYGFILRYPENKENITGYMYEEWHFRYVGKETAKYIYTNNITFDEYIAKGIK